MKSIKLFVTVFLMSLPGLGAVKGKAFQCSFLGYFEHISDCRKYYYCFLNPQTLSLEATVLECPTYHHFDKNSNYGVGGCEPGKCKSTSTQSPTTTTPADPPKLDCTVMCDLKEDKIMPNPGDCNSFFYCSNGTPHRVKCPESLVFNQEKEICDWPYNYKCHETKCTSGHIFV